MVYFFLMIVLSYTVVIQPAYDPPEDEIITEEGMEELTPDNTYVQKEGDKYYMIYKNDIDEISKEDAEEMKMSGFEVKENEENRILYRRSSGRHHALWRLRGLCGRRRC